MGALLETFWHSFDRWRALREVRALDSADEEGYRGYFNENISSAKEALGVGDRKRALAIWNEMYARFPRLCAQSKTAIWLMLDLGLLNDAERILRAGEKRYPGNPQFALGLVELDRRRGNVDGALARCEVLQKKFPNDADGYIIYAGCLTALGRLVEADTLLKRATDRFPNDCEVLIGYARAAERRKDWHEAVGRWKVVRSRFDNPSTALGMAGPLRLAGHISEAEEIVIALLLRAPGNHWAHAEMARIAASSGDLDKEAQCWASVRKQSPNLALGYLEGAQAARRAGREQEADEILFDAVQREIPDLAIYIEYARGAERRGGKAAAVDRWALVRERFPEYDGICDFGGDTDDKLALGEPPGVQDEAVDEPLSLEQYKPVLGLTNSRADLAELDRAAVEAERMLDGFDRRDEPNSVASIKEPAVTSIVTNEAPAAAPSQRLNGDKRAILGFGHSHLIAIRSAFKCRAHSGDSEWAIHDVDLGNPRYQPWIDFRNGMTLFNEKLLSDIVDQINCLKPALVFSVLAGADYLAHAIVQNPRPFDVIIPGEEHLPRIESAEIVPYRLICSIYRHNLLLAFRLLQQVSDSTGAQIFHFCPPAPVGDPDHIKKYPGELLRPLIEEFGLAPAILRYKLWRLYVNLVRETCTEYGATFVDVPPESVDAAGFLREEFCALDPVHGNAAYGELVIRQMISLTNPVEGR